MVWKVAGETCVTIIVDDGREEEGKGGQRSSYMSQKSNLGREQSERYEVKETEVKGSVTNRSHKIS